MQTTWRLLTWRGVPIRLHWTLLLGLPWFYVLLGDIAGMALGFAAFLLLLLVHELGHAIMAKWRKIPVLEIRLFILHGYCEHEEAEQAADAVWIAWGGVLAQALLLALALGARELLLRQDFFAFVALGPVWYTLIGTNLVVIALNLLPVPPLDGAKAWQVLPLTWARIQRTHWFARRRFNSDVRRRRKERRIDEESHRIAADIIEKLKKRP